MSEEEKPKTVSVMIPVEGDEGRLETVHAPILSATDTIGEITARAYKMKRERSPSPEFMEKLMVLVPVADVNSARELMKTMGKKGTRTLYELEQDDEGDRLVAMTEIAEEELADLREEERAKKIKSGDEPL